MKNKLKKYHQPRNVLKEELYIGLNQRELFIMASLSVVIILLSVFVTIYIAGLYILVGLYYMVFGRFTDDSNIYTEVKKNILYSLSTKLVVRKCNEESEDDGQDNKRARSKKWLLYIKKQ